MSYNSNKGFTTIKVDVQVEFKNICRYVLQPLNTQFDYHLQDLILSCAPGRDVSMVQCAPYLQFSMERKGRVLVEKVQISAIPLPVIVQFSTSWAC